ncbi:SchA/CurD-like domain-containing protein [Kitasatospora sp. NBC_01266]|uniref:SchA/CurD-like domain-containing protein n=1 Tax=Kitasatospora sp. NBC_01266 TaxID=2903572 RepID=UPI002E2FCE56|nr:SchA/CurD-like domain-containing protein [Kitasatospora sp. NBC_01266]
MTTLSDRPAPPAALATSRLRVVLLLDVHDGREESFLAAYEQIRHQVADVPGHISDQLCQSLGNSSQWLITSEWESAEPFLTWVESAAHREVVEPLHACVSDTRSLRFVIARETPEPGTPPPHRPPARSAGHRPATVGGRSRMIGIDPLPAPPLSSGGLVRHALTFTVKPGSERAVAGILAGYRSPQAQVDGTTRLCRTSLFMRGNRVVRAVEVRGDLGNALRHVAMQPEVRAVEEAVNPHLEEARDLGDPSSARSFFARAALPAVHHVGSGPDTSGLDPDDGEFIRLAFLYPVKPGRGEAAAQLLAEQDRSVVGDQGQPLAGSTMFLRDGILVRLVDLRVPYQEAPAQAAGLALDRASTALSRCLDLDADTDLDSRAGIIRFLADCAMELVTDRHAPPSESHTAGDVPSIAATGE